MATEATEAKVKTRDQVEGLLKEGKNAKEIAEATGKTLATVYVHIRNIQGGKKTGKRGRPPKVESGSEKPAAPAAQTRARPPVGGSGSGAGAASQNGHDASRFPKIKIAIEDELKDARSKVTTLEKMLESIG